MENPRPASSLTAPRPQAARFGPLLLAAWTLAVFLLATLALPRFAPAGLNLYFFQPALWLSVAALALALQLRAGQQAQLFQKLDLALTGALLGGIQAAVLVLFGLLSGFGASPYAREIWLVALNLWFAGTRLLGIEAARWYLGVTLGKKSHALGFLAAWLLPLLLIIPIGKYSLLGAPASAARVAGETLLPAAAENLLAAFLAISGGPLASMAYRGVLQAFEWLSPILPDLPWMATAFAGVLVPALGLIALSRPEPAPAAAGSPKKAGAERAPAAAWLLVGALAVGVIWLNTGFLGVRPSLLSGNSMNPTLYPGDVVLTRQVPPESIRVGDIVRFHRDGIDYVHRVTAIQDDDGQLVFTTRGDNNNVDDAPVPAALVEGRLILTVPKIGWASIYLRQALTWVGGLL
jgi:signal peptidase